MALTDQEIVRREKLQKLTAKGIDPFGQKFLTTHHSVEAKKLAEGKTHDELEAAAMKTSIAGRLVLLRNMGKASFVTIQDKLGSIQAYIRKDVIGDESYSIFELADLGDIVGVQGTLMLTKTGEITVKVTTYTHLVKSLRPLPEKYHGLSDVEERYRRRYVDLIVNEDARKVALMRPRIIRMIQQHMDPEFTTIEAYQAYGDIDDMKALAENLLSSIAKALTGSYDLPWGEKTISLKPPFRSVHMVDLIKEHTGIDFFAPMSFEQAKALADKHNIHLDKHENAVGYVINKFFETFCEKKLIQPTFVTGHPLEISPLAKKSKDARFTERFELFIDGSEYANAFTELNNPLDQEERFQAQVEAKTRGDKEASENDIDFLEALQFGMPPAGGIGIGIDRLVMLLTNQSSIREVILFPTLKTK